MANQLDVLPHKWDTKVRLGGIAGHALVYILGHDSELSTSRVTLSPGESSVDISQSAIHATPATVLVSSASTADAAAGVGLHTLLLQGLSSSGVQQEETITLTGQTAVTSSNTYSSINGMVGKTAGSSNKNSGIVYAGSGSITAGVPAVRMFAMESGLNKGFTSYYTVPAAKSAIFRSIVITMSIAGKIGEVYIDTSADGVLWVTEMVVSVESTGPIKLDTIAIPVSAADTHIRVSASSAGSPTNITMALALELIDD